MKTYKKIIFIGFIFLVALSVFIFYGWQKPIFSEEKKIEPEANLVIFPDKIVDYEIVANDTYGVIMTNQGISSADAKAIYLAAQKQYDLAKISVGKKIKFYFRPETDEFYKLHYQIDSEEELWVEKNDDGLWQATRQAIPYEVKIITSSGKIEKFLYADALSAGVDERAVIAWAEMLQWSLDFAMDIRVGDFYKFIYEQRFLNGEYIMPGRVLAGKFINDGKAYYGFYYQDPEGNVGYYDEHGNNVQKMFLKAPVAFKYISSGFTTGIRYIQAFNISTGHRAIDYAASLGTPVRSVSDGTVIFAGRDGSYGNKVSIRHNGTYATNYAHLSKILVKRGQKVSQGDVIGLVGSTGLSTGPHLHYEMVKNGVKINPLREVLPPGEALKQEYQNDYFNSIADWKKQLDE